MIIENKISSLSGLIILFIGCGAIAWAYFNGLSGEFLFDDFPNLAILDQFERDGVWVTLKYLMSNIGISSARPIAYLSFYADISGWPNDASKFKVTNIVFHIANIGLVFLLFYRLALYLDMQKPLWVSVLAALLWGCNPIHVSTVLYVVQRMAILSAFFMILALYLLLVSFGAKGCWRWGWLAASGFFALCSVLSKESGALYFGFILVLVPLLKSNKIGVLWLRIVKLLAVCGSICIFVYLLMNFDLFVDIYETRGFKLYDRILIESQILAGYVAAAFFPFFAKFGLFFDNYDVAARRGEAFESFIYLIGLTLILVFFSKIRKLDKLLAFGIMWFLVGHLLESTLLPLELAYDHRNYVPLMGLCFWLSVMIIVRIPKVTEVYKINPRLCVYYEAGVRFAIILCSVGVLYAWFGVMWAQTNIWRSNYTLVFNDYQGKPNSVRAKMALAELMYAKGHSEVAVNLILEANKVEPENILVLLRLVYVDCHSPLAESALSQVGILASKSAQYNGAVLAVKQLLDQILVGECPRSHLDKVVDIVKSMRNNKAYLLNSAQKAELDKLYLSVSEG